MPDPGTRIIFQDIDGCLNPADGEGFGVVPEWEPSPNQVAMLEQIDRALEHSPVESFVINTGRPWSLVRNLAKHLRSAKARYFLLEHACVIYDRETDSYVDSIQMAEDCGMYELAARYRNVDLIHVLFDWYRESGQERLESHYQADLTALEKVGNLTFPIPKGVDGAELLARFESMVIAEFDSGKVGQLEFMRSDQYIDILPGVHKLDGIHLLTAHLGIDLAEALAVGDFLNDLQVFESFHRVLCPANAHPQIKALARSKGAGGRVADEAYGPALVSLLRSLG